jgi:hypothetical protein
VEGGEIRRHLLDLRGDDWLRRGGCAGKRGGAIVGGGLGGDAERCIHWVLFFLPWRETPSTPMVGIHSTTGGSWVGQKEKN